MRCVVMPVVVLGVFLLGGCKQKAADGEAMDAQQTVDVYIEELARVEAEQGLHVMGEQGMEMLARIEDAALQQQLLQYMVQTVLAAEAYDVVTGMVPPLMANQEELAVLVVRWAGPTMLEQAPDPWLTLLLEQTDSMQIRAHGLLGWIHLYAAHAGEDELAMMVGRMLSADMQEFSEYLVRSLIEVALGSEDAERKAVVLAMLEEQAAAPDVLRLVQSGYVRLALQEQDAGAALARMQQQADLLGDQALARLLRSLLAQTDDDEVLHAVETWVYADAQQELQVTRRQYAMWQMRQLRDQQDVEALSHVVARALDAGVEAQALVSRFVRNHFYGLMETASEADRKRVLAILHSLQLAAGEGMPEGLRTSLAMAKLDGYYYLKDFASALALVEAGIPGQDEAWHEELRDKVAAHLALQEGRYADAVERFRRHIDRTRQWEKPIHAPDTGRLIVADEVIALNERRIGDILLLMPEHEDEAAEAYARAAQHYQMALDQYADDPVSEKVIRAEWKDLQQTTGTAAGSDTQ